MAIFNIRSLAEQLGRNIAVGQAYEIAQEKGFAELPPILSKLPYPGVLIPNPPSRLIPQGSSVLQGREILVTDMLIDNSFRFPIPPIVRLNKHKNVVMTPVAGRDYTVKEIIAAEDWKIAMTGIVVNEDFVQSSGGDFQLPVQEVGYPLDFLQELNNLCERNEALEVNCELFNILKIDRIVITDFEPSLEGYHNAFAYTIQALSDTSFELELLEEE